MYQRRMFLSLALISVFFAGGSFKRHGIILTSHEFVRLVKTPGFIDKSMFIKHFLRAPFHSVVNTPRKFGKSLNIDMLKTFFEIPMTSTGREDPARIRIVTETFTNNNLYIAEKIVFATVQVHFMKYPVIHFDFKKINTTSLEVFESSFADMIEAEFKRHSYVALNATGATLAMYNKGIPPAKNRFDESTGYTLSMLLHMFHQKPCIVLIDNYDFPLVTALFSKHLSEGDTQLVTDFLSRFMSGLVKGNFYVTRSLLVGCSSLGSMYRKYSNNLKYYHVLENKILLVRYFGFSRGDVSRLAEFTKEDELKTIHAWYGGHRMTNGESLYCPSSVLHYFKTREFKSFWPKDWFPLSDAFNSTELTQKIKETIDKDMDVMFEEQYELTDVARLKNTIHPSEGYSNVSEKFMSFLLQQMTEDGVYTVKNHLSTIEKTITVTNQETKIRLQEIV